MYVFKNIISTSHPTVHVFKGLIKGIYFSFNRIIIILENPFIFFTDKMNIEVKYGYLSWLYVHYTATIYYYIRI